MSKTILEDEGVMQLVNFLAFFFDHLNTFEKSDVVFLWFAGLACVIIVGMAIIRLKPPKEKKN